MARLVSFLARTRDAGRVGWIDVAAYLYLASEAMSGFVTGQILEVNGGMLIA